MSETGPMRKLEKDQVWLDFRKNLLMMTVSQDRMLLLVNCEFPVVGLIEMNTVTMQGKVKESNGEGLEQKRIDYMFLKIPYCFSHSIL